MDTEYIVQFRPAGGYARRRICDARFSSLTYHVPFDSANAQVTRLTSWQPRCEAVCSFHLKLSYQQDIHSVRFVETDHQSRFVPTERAASVLRTKRLRGPRIG